MYAQGLQKHKHDIDTVIIDLLNACAICATVHNWTQCIDGFSLWLQRFVRKGNDAKNPAILSFSFVTEGTQSNAVHACRVKKLRLNAELEIEIHPFLENHSLEFHKNWNKNTLGNKWLEYWKKFEL